MDLYSQFRQNAHLSVATLVLMAAIIWPGVAGAFAQPSFPALTGRVVDDADVLSADQEQILSAKLEALENATTDQFVVATLSSLQGYEIRDYGYQLGRFWQIGRKDRNNGVLLVVAPKERKVAIEVGYGLEGTLTDAITKLIIENAIIPKFKKGDLPGGVSAGAEKIIAILSGDKEMVLKLRSAQQRGQWITIAFTVAIISFVLLIFIFNIFGGGTRRRSGGSGRSSGGWASGGGWSSGGGGFSGGGGSFGGGGSSGSW